MGNDWLVGGTGSDQLFGGLGNDILNVDDNLDTNGGANTSPDAPEYADADIAFGGGGRDTMIANTGADRLIDWNGEYNAYVVPFSAFGAPTITRSHNPSIVEFLIKLSRAAGGDQTRTTGSTTPSTDYGELGLQLSGETGPPTDPQPGNGKAKKDTK